MKRKGIWILLAILLVIIGIVLWQQQPTKQEKKVIKIGAILPLTGEGAVWGNNAKKGIELALQELNSDNSLNFKVKVLFEDSHTDPKSAVSALRKLISKENIQCSIVDMISSNVLAMAPIANSNQVVIISPGASSPEITKAGPFVFRNWPSDALQGVVNAQFAFSELKWRKAAIIYVLNAYGEGLRDSFTSEFEKLGGSVLIMEGIQKGASDARNQISKVQDIYKKQALDGIYLAIYPTEHPVILKQLKEANFNISLLATETFDDPNIYTKPFANGVVFSVPAPPDSSSIAVKIFRKNFKIKFGEEPGITADAAYDALKLLVLCIKNNGYYGPKIANCLSNIKNYDGAAGNTTFDKNGDVIKPFIFKMVKNGKLINWSNKVYLPKNYSE